MGRGIHMGAITSQRTNTSNCFSCLNGYTYVFQSCDLQAALVGKAHSLVSKFPKFASDLQAIILAK